MPQSREHIESQMDKREENPNQEILSDEHLTSGDPLTFNLLEICNFCDGRF